MVLHTSELVEAAALVAERDNMRITLVSSLGGAGFTGATTFSGGVLGGPIGLLFGAVIGGISSYLYTKGKFKSVVSIIREDMTTQEKEKLASHLQSAIQDFDIADAIELSTLLITKKALFCAVKMALTQYLENDMHMKLI